MERHGTAGGRALKLGQKEEGASSSSIRFD